jgi:branched-subunit amino acid aminotransferase/4-amino-4-deoxychorismate lyase
LKILDLENYPFLKNSSLLRGEQVFTSMLLYNGKMLFFHQHLTRLLKGASFLFPQYKWDSFEDEIRIYVLEQVKKFESKNYYCRLTIVDDCFFMIHREHEVTSATLSLARAVQLKALGLKPEFLKLGQYAESLLELRHASSKNSDDIAFYDQNNFLTEASTSNVVIVKQNGEMATPHLSSMVLDGILRAGLLSKFSIKEENITESDLLLAREIWLTNSIKGIRFVKQYEQNNYEISNSVYHQVIETFGRYGEKNCEQKS